MRLICDECGAALRIVRHARGITDTFTRVAPCEECMREAERDGQERTKDTAMWKKVADELPPLDAPVHSTRDRTQPRRIPSTVKRPMLGFCLGRLAGILCFRGEMSPSLGCPLPNAIEEISALEHDLKMFRVSAELRQPFRLELFSLLPSHMNIFHVVFGEQF